MASWGGALAAILLARALELMTPARVAVFIALHPLAAVGLGVTLLGESITVQSVPGFGCVVVAIGTVHWPTPRSAASGS